MKETLENRLSGAIIKAELLSDLLYKAKDEKKSLGSDDLSGIALLVDEISCVLHATQDEHTEALDKIDRIKELARPIKDGDSTRETKNTSTNEVSGDEHLRFYSGITDYLDKWMKKLYLVDHLLCTKADDNCHVVLPAGACDGAVETLWEIAEQLHEQNLNARKIGERIHRKRCT